MLKAIQFEQGQFLSIPLAFSQTILKGSGLVWSSGFLAAAPADEEIVNYTAQEDLTTDGSSHTPISVLPCSASRIRYEVDVSANTAAAQRGLAYELSDSSTVDNAATATANGFLMDEIVGAPGDKKARGFFL